MPAAALLRRRWPSMLPRRALVSRISRFRRNKSRRRRPVRKLTLRKICVPALRDALRSEGECSKLQSLGLVFKSQLLKHRLSDNVGAVKQFLSTLPHALREARHFALDEKAVPTKARL